MKINIYNKESEEQLAARHFFLLGVCMSGSPSVDSRLAKYIGNWNTNENNVTYNSDVVCGIYGELDSEFLVKLELSQYLEQYLIPLFPTNTSKEHILSILCILNQKAKLNIPTWTVFKDCPSKLNSLFEAVLPLPFGNDLSVSEQVILLSFLQHAFQSLEEDDVNRHVMRLVSIPTWANLTSAMRDSLLKNRKRLLKQWRTFEKKDKEGNNKSAKKMKTSNVAHSTPQSSESDTFFYEKYFMWQVLKGFNATLASVTEDSQPITILYCEKMVDLVTDLLAQLPTRRFFRPLLQQSFFLPSLNLCSLMSSPKGRLFRILVEKLHDYYFFALDDFTGAELTRDEIEERHCEKIQHLQVLAYQSFSPVLRPFSLRNIGAVEHRSSLRSNLSLLQPEELRKLAELLYIVNEESEEIKSEFLLETILLMHEKQPTKSEKIGHHSIYPNEDDLWQKATVSECNYLQERCVDLPKLNLQFLSFYDYLQRNFTLYRLESTYELKEDIEDVVKRVAPRLSLENRTEFTGWARMSAPVMNFSMNEVSKPNLGETWPSSVKGTVTINVGTMRPDVKQEWEAIHKNEVLFLLQIVSPIPRGEQPDMSKAFAEAFGVRVIRGCQVVEVQDEKGNRIKKDGTVIKKEKEETDKPRRRFSKFSDKEFRKDPSLQKRCFQVAFDPQQYYVDLRDDNDYIYEETTTFNLLVRRTTKLNSFKGVLESIRTMMHEDRFVVPEWFQDVFLGYGDPAARPPHASTIQWKDSFLNIEHVNSVFEDWKKVEVVNPKKLALAPPFESSNPKDSDIVQITPIEKKNNLFTLPTQLGAKKRNQIPFTRTQCSAIQSAMSEGLTVVVGPPGTGKTDIAVQIIHLLYQNHPDQRTLIITHSNQALDQLFEKIIDLDIDQRHLLRLGNKSKQVGAFNYAGRVDLLLANRLALLKQVQRLAKTISNPLEVSDSCERAEIFFTHTIKAQWNRFLSNITEDTANDAVSTHFPFKDFFQQMPQSGRPTLFTKERESDLVHANLCYEFLLDLFAQLAEIRPFELLSETEERTDYLLVKQAKIVAMTATHAAVRRNDLVRLGFHVDNLVMEEAAQVMDVETIIPMLSRKASAWSQHNQNPLRRLILLGDHHQLPPKVKRDILRYYSHLDQSLFARFVRLGVPVIKLDMQGRARPSLANLYNWKYKPLGNLPVVTTQSNFLTANPGFQYEYQFIDISEEYGGETEPVPSFYQNVAEAEFVVAVYQYMRLLGYPSSSISIITSYKGQKQLLRDIVKQRCSTNFFGFPHKITTVDQYQGQQNDYILFSMVRTRNVGHIRDLRRLIVSMSRARLGLYVFGKSSLFSTCAELQETFSLLLARSTSLALIPSETYPTSRKVSDQATESTEISNFTQMAELCKKMASSKF